MNTLSNYMSENKHNIRLITNVNGRLKVGNTYSSKLMIFDIDDTLLITDTKVFVVKDNRIIASLSAGEFNEYVLGDGENFDFSDFKDISSLRRGTFTPYMNTLRREYSKGTHICILTARRNTAMIKEFFLENGIDIKDEVVIAVNDPMQPYEGSTSERKAQAIKNLVEKGKYDTVVFFDDNAENLKEAKAMEKELGINIITVHATPNYTLSERLRKSLKINA